MYLKLFNHFCTLCDIVVYRLIKMFVFHYDVNSGYTLKMWGKGHH